MDKKCSIALYVAAQAAINLQIYTHLSNYSTCLVVLMTATSLFYVLTATKDVSHWPS